MDCYMLRPQLLHGVGAMNQGGGKGVCVFLGGRVMDCMGCVQRGAHSFVHRILLHEIADLVDGDKARPL